MTRLPPLAYDATDAAQRAVWDRIVATRGGIGDMTDANGSLVGPFHAMTMRPHLGEHMAELGSAVRFEGSLEPRLLELAICTVGARWKSEFEFWAHRRIGLDAGLAEHNLDALAAGHAPEFSLADERAVHEFTEGLLTTGHPAPAVYEELVDLIGPGALIDLTITIGYYCQISFVLNAFAVALPAGVDPIWP